MDFFADNMVKRIIGEIILHKDKIPDNKTIWFNLTKCMLRNYNVAQVYGMIEQAIEEIADEQWFEHKYPKGFFNETWVFPKKKSVVKINLKKARIRKQIKDNLKITDVAKSYGLIVKNEKALCPFHDDREPSLSFSDAKNVFNCFGCNAKGDIIGFIRRIETLSTGELGMYDLEQEHYWKEYYWKEKKGGER